MLATMVLTTRKGASPGPGMRPCLLWDIACVASAPAIPGRILVARLRPAPRCPLVFGRKSVLHRALAASILGFLVGDDEGLLGFVAGVVTPVGLHEPGVDLLQIDGFGVVAHGFDERADTEVPDGPQDAFRDAQDEVERFVGEGVVRQAGEVELGVEIGFQGVRGEGVEFGGVGAAALEVAVGAELEGGVEGGLAEQDEVVVFGEVF